MLGESVRNGVATVGTSVVQVSPQVQTGQVTARVFTNVSTGGQAISLSWGGDAVAGSGVVLYPAGSWSESLDSVFIPSNLSVSAIASAANGSLAIHERIRG